MSEGIQKRTFEESLVRLQSLREDWDNLIEYMREARESYYTSMVKSQREGRADPYVDARAIGQMIAMTEIISELDYRGN